MGPIRPRERTRCSECGFLTMRPDVSKSEANNFGFPEHLVTCRSDPAVLHEFMKNGKSVVWRRPEDAAITVYQQKHMDDIYALHNINFAAEVPPEGPVVLTPQLSSDHFVNADIRQALGV